MADLLEGIPLSQYDPQLVAEICEAVRSYCGWHIAPSIEETRDFEVPPGRGHIVLPTYQLTAVESVLIDDVALLTDEFDVWLGRKARIDIGRVYYHCRATITFTHGYAVAPPDVVRVVKALAGGGTSGASVRVGGVQISSASAAVGLPSLRGYQLPAVA